MKKVFLMLMALVPALLFAQTPDNFTITGKTGTLNAPARAYLVYDGGTKDIVDSTVLVNGGFKFHGHIVDPSSGFIAIDPTGIGINTIMQKRVPIDFLNIYVDKANIVLVGTDSIAKAKITGSKVNDDNEKLRLALLPLSQRVAAINLEYNSANDAQKINPVFLDTIKARSIAVQNDQTVAMKKFIQANPNSFISLITMRTLIRGGMSPDKVEPYYNGLSAEIKQTELGKGFGGLIAQLKVATVGTMAPEFTQNDVNGTPVTLSSFKGKYLLIDFWASWCIPCRTENPHIVKVYDHYKDKKFAILGVSLDKPTDKELWLKAIKDDGLTWTQVSDLKYWQNDVAVLYKVSLIPQNFLIDPTGKIIAKNLTGAELDAKLLEIFKM